MPALFVWALSCAGSTSPAGPWSVPFTVAPSTGCPPASVSALNPWTNSYSAAPSNTSGTVIAGSFAVSSGTNRLLLVAVVMEIDVAKVTDNMTISATYGGTALSLAGKATTNQREIIWMGYLKNAQIAGGTNMLSVTYNTNDTLNKVSALHVKWAAYAGVNQASPFAGVAAQNSGATSVTFGAPVDYVTNGMTLVVAGNGGNKATGALTATPPFTAEKATQSNNQTSRPFVTAKHTAAGSYAASTAVTWSGTTNAWSALVAVSLQP